ncbi:hypothetical protein CR205_15945 [Alteribacter lacisalsi]|uniref:Glycosyltransferase n=1 Tax=Alteribacter lacisalsi TaxID=2045244 RepID=A0A2W0H262_9BACI|nr:glycosyltransferase family 4 protein [Alteribacter lacisalsi]PYZ95873.1 hypothetical protein CR205_15945 [Alteribacter lacisalsi]
MKVLYVYRDLLLGGVTIQLANRREELDKHVTTHYAFTKDHKGRSAFKNPEGIFITETPGELAGLIRENNYDAVVIIDTPAAFEALDQAEFKGKVILEVHGTSHRIEYLDEVPPERYEAVLTPSSYVKSYLEERFRISEEKVKIVPNCVNTELFRPFNTDEDVPDEPVIMWIGKLDLHKNWPLFLDFCTRLLAERDDVRFYMAGGETASDRVVNEFLDVLSRKRLTEKVTWISRAEQKWMPHLYNQVGKSGGFTVSTSKNESFGMTMIESLACKTPVLFPAVGAIPSILTGELAEMQYEPENIEEMTAKALQFLDHKERTLKLAEAGFEQTLASYKPETVVRTYLDMFTQVVR